MPRKKKLKKNQSTHLQIELSTDLFLRFKGKRGFFPSYLIGLKPSVFLIIKTPAIISKENLLSKGSSITIRYSYLGDIYAFNTTVMGTHDEPFKVTFLSYPEVVEKIEYRDTQRVSSNFPATLLFGDTKVKGVITDISEGGCKFRTDAADHIENLLLKRDSDVVLNFPLLGLEGIREFKGKIKKVAFDNDYSLGIGFCKIDDESRQIIVSYVKETIGYRGK